MTTQGNVEEALKYYTALPYSVIVERWDDGGGSTGWLELWNSLIA